MPSFAIALSNDAASGDDRAGQGDPTETALFAHARAAGFDKDALSGRYPREHELPFVLEDLVKEMGKGK